MEWSPDLEKYPRYWHSRLKAGFGLGIGASYKPWLRVRDVPSRGSSGNPHGIRVDRTYHLLSNFERSYFKHQERCQDITDIREGFPILHLAGTLQLCAELGVRHPRRGQYLEPFTIDFLITRRTSNGFVDEAKSIKSPEDALDPETRLRESVPYLWCKHYGIDWKLVDTSGFTKDLEATLTFIRGWFRHRHVPDQARAVAFSKHFQSIYARNIPLRELVEKCAKQLRLPYTLCENEFRYCAWSKLIPVDVTERMALNFPVVLHGS